MSRRVEIVEVGPRDGLQNERVALSPEDRIAFIRMLEAAGSRRIEAVSFVHPGRVPQMAGAEEEMAAFPEKLRAQMEAWTYQTDEGPYVLCSDGAKFMNHSFEPNCDDHGNWLTVAGRDIEAGEEVICDYREFDVKSNANGLPEYHRAAS